MTKESLSFWVLGLWQLLTMILLILLHPVDAMLVLQDGRQVGCAGAGGGACGAVCGGERGGGT